jgi:hypothetical protein
MRFWLLLSVQSDGRGAGCRGALGATPSGQRFRVRWFQIEARLPDRHRRPGGGAREVALLPFAMLKRQAET